MRYGLLALGLVCAAHEGQAVTFDVFSTEGNGTVVSRAIAGEPGSFVWRIIGSDTGVPSFDFPATGVVAFADRAYRIRGEFRYRSLDADGPAFDRFVAFATPDFFELSDSEGPFDQSGRFDFRAERGALFGFAVESADDLGGPAIVDVRAQVALVPLPPALAFMIAGLAALGGLAWRRSGFEHAA